ncbi:MAG: helix-turn-helix domain-containing protein [Bacteroidales bacterium]|nr:helix-turn-helix domain-containing protein [Bacteroidales bacterium]
MDDAQLKSLIRKLRTDQGITQGMMAARLGIDERTYKRVEAEDGTHLVYPRIADIARILGVSLEELLGVDNEGTDSYVEEIQREPVPSLLKDERDDYEEQIALLKGKLEESREAVKSLQQDVSRLGRCLDDKDQIIAWLREELEKCRGGNLPDGASTQK